MVTQALVRGFVVAILFVYLYPHDQVDASQALGANSLKTATRLLHQQQPGRSSDNNSSSGWAPLVPPLRHKASPFDLPDDVQFYTYQGNSSYQGEKLPVLFLLNGANVEATYYSQLASLLASRGYTFIASDYYRFFQNLRCPKKQSLSTSAALIKTWLDYVELDKGAKENPVLKELTERGLVLISHSFGGLTATNIIDGDCKKRLSPLSLITCEGYQPPLASSSPPRTSTSSSSSSKDVKVTCPAIRLPLTPTSAGKKQDSSSFTTEKGPVARLSSTPLIRGAISWEGYAGSGLPPFITPAGITVPPGMFFMYLGGQYNNNTAEAYELTKASSSNCSCAAFAKFPGLNHYGITNWQPEGSHQVTPCAKKVPADPKDFKVSKERQEAGLKDQAKLIDLIVRSVGLREARAQQELAKLQQQGGVPGAAGYSLSMKGACT